MTRGKMNERGASAVEYGLLVALVAVAVIAGLQIMGLLVGGVFAGTCSELAGATC